MVGAKAASKRNTEGSRESGRQSRSSRQGFESWEVGVEDKDRGWSKRRGSGLQNGDRMRDGSRKVTGRREERSFGRKGKTVG